MENPQSTVNLNAKISAKSESYGKKIKTNANDFVVLLDVDGTIVPPKSSKMDLVVLNKIKECKSRGTIFVLTTGRSPAETFSLKNVEIFNFIACLFGNIIYAMPQKEIVHMGQPCKKSEVARLAKFLDENNINWSYKNNFGEKSYKYPERLHVVDMLEKSEFYKHFENDDIFQVMTYGYIPKEIIQQFNYFDFIYMPHNYTDIVRNGVSKAITVEYFRKLFPTKKIVAVGDSENDLGMFENADISIAMGNAKTEIKSKVDFVTKSVTEHGVVYALEKILKI